MKEGSAGATVRPETTVDVEHTYQQLQDEHSSAFNCQTRSAQAVLMASEITAAEQGNNSRQSEAL